MQLLVKLSINSSSGEQIRKDIEQNFACKSEFWLLTEYDETVKGFWKISHCSYVVKMIDLKGLEDEVKKLNTMLLHLSSFVLSNKKRNMNTFIRAFMRFHTKDVYYTKTHSLFIEHKHWKRLDNGDSVGKNY